MHPSTVRSLLDLNRRFYTAFGADFAATRRRIQPGVRRVLEGLPDAGRWLDLGCGSGALAAEWLRAGRSSRYAGLDFSAELLAEARAAVEGLPGAPGQVIFLQRDLSDPGWAEGLPRVGAPGGFTGALAFAVLHHLPSRALRLDVLRRLRALLPPGGRFFHSQWQFQHSPRLMERRLPWSAAGLDDNQVEPGDTLLDWRYTLQGEARTGLRYVHLFTGEALAEEAAASGFRVVDAFDSDGHGGRLALYQAWEAA
jgi:SAM-dependent methyltransferase